MTSVLRRRWLILGAAVVVAVFEKALALVVVVALLFSCAPLTAMASDNEAATKAEKLAIAAQADLSKLKGKKAIVAFGGLKLKKSHKLKLAKAIKSKVIVIEAGHQAKANVALEPVAPGSKTKKMKVTGGTSGRWTKLPEYKVNLYVAKKLAKELRDRGYTVYMTRTSNKVNISNVQRAKFANSKKADLVIRLHCDGTTSSAVKGFLTCTPAKTKFTSKFYAKSLKAAKVIHKAVLKTTKATNRGIVKRSDLSGFNWSKVPVILFEMGVMTNRSDDYKLASAKYQNKLAKGMTKGVDNLFSKFS